MKKDQAPPIMSTEDLSIGYKKGKESIKVLKNINLSLYEGQIICVLGPNGIGKSTLLRTLAGVQKPLEGEVTLGSRPITSYKKEELARLISLVLTERIPSGNLDVYNLVSLGRFPHTGWAGTLRAEDLEKIDESIELTQIHHLKDKKVSELSDGELQKVMIARALAQDGQVIILDEPTAHLDVSNRISIMSLLRKLALKTGKSILVSTHDLDLALQTADIFWLVSGSKVIYKGTPEDLVLNGELAMTFEKEDFNFDLQTGGFRIKKMTTLNVDLKGTGIALYWVKHALERNGFAVHPSSQIKLSVSSEEEEKFNISYNNQSFSYSSIEEVLDHLKKLPHDKLV